MAANALTVRAVLWENVTDGPLDGFEFFKTKGIKDHRNKIFQIQLNGIDIHHLIGLLVRGAETADDFSSIRKFVLFADEIQHQAKAQGY